MGFKSDPRSNMGCFLLRLGNLTGARVGIRVAVSKGDIVVAIPSDVKGLILTAFQGKIKYAVIYSTGMKVTSSAGPGAVSSKNKTTGIRDAADEVPSPYQFLSGCLRGGGSASSTINATGITRHFYRQD